MQDRFRFRMYDKEKKIMLYGDSEILRTEKVYEYEELWWATTAVPISAISYFFDCNSEERFVLQQCTGFKDKNGKLIYEGDILKVVNGSINGIGLSDKWIVKWIDNGWNIRQWSFDCTHSYEVIGNIYENKELLEEQK